LFPDVKPIATIRDSPEDFVVEEIPAFEPSGEGEHLYLEIKKTNVTTNDAVKRICAALGIDERGAGYAGMKDKRAVTTQMVSVPFARARSIDDALAVEVEGIAVLRAVRHAHKLKPGHLKGNRFAIVLRNMREDDVPAVIADLEDAGRRGVPNAFGPQRFGKDGDNPERALAWLAGRTPGPKDRRERRILFSALQAHVFNRVLDIRRERGTYSRPLLGDLIKKTDTGGIFLCTDPVTDEARAERGEIAPTGPIFGAKMRWPEGEPARIEREMLRECVGDEAAFDAHPALGEGSRRPMVLRASDLAVERLGEEPGALRVVFVLPKGGYATTLLASGVALHERTVMR
jgi:tRNA pseudouridine13 synthase